MAMLQNGTSKLPHCNAVLLYSEKALQKCSSFRNSDQIPLKSVKCYRVYNYYSLIFCTICAFEDVKIASEGERI